MGMDAYFYKRTRFGGLGEKIKEVVVKNYDGDEIYSEAPSDYGISLEKIVGYLRNCRAINREVEDDEGSGSAWLEFEDIKSLHKRLEKIVKIGKLAKKIGDHADELYDLLAPDYGEQIDEAYYSEVCVAERVLKKIIEDYEELPEEIQKHTCYRYECSW